MGQPVPAGDSLAGRSVRRPMGQPFVEDDPHSELFFSWLFHRWSPQLEKGYQLDDDTLYGVPPTCAYLARNAGLSPTLREYLETCLATPFSFYQVLDCNPYMDFNARDLLTGEEFAVNDAVAASTLKQEDIIFAHIPIIEEVGILDAISPFSFPPSFKARLSRRRRQQRFRERDDRALRKLYFTLLESYLGG